MRVTIVVPDNIVLIDGVPHSVDCSGLVEQGIHAVQWYDTHGEVEYVTSHVGGVFVRKQNAVIKDIGPFGRFVAMWNIEDTRIKQEEAEAAAEVERTREQREQDAITVMSRAQNP